MKMLKNTLLLFMFFLCSYDIAIAQQQKQQPRYYKDIQAFKKQDSISFPPKQSILFVGSSSITRWKSIQKDLGQYGNIINRGFGGSNLSQAIYYANDIIIPYDVKAIFIYSGENDVPNERKDEQAIFKDFKTLFTKIRASKRRTPIIYISIKPSIRQRKRLDKITKTNTLIENYLSKQKNAHFLDVHSAMLTPAGEPNPDIFVKDDLHMNEAGYRIWIDKLTPYLEKYK